MNYVPAGHPLSPTLPREGGGSICTTFMRLPCGFTLVEMVITVALVGILAVAVLPIAELTVQRQREQELRQGLRQIRSAIDAYKLACEEKKIKCDKVGDKGYPPSLSVLEQGVEDPLQPGKVSIRFLRRLPRDPFAADPAQSAADTWGKRSYDSPPDAPSEGSDVYDVYSRSERIGLNGIAYREW